MVWGLLQVACLLLMPLVFLVLVFMAMTFIRKFSRR